MRAAPLTTWYCIYNARDGAHTRCVDALRRLDAPVGGVGAFHLWRREAAVEIERAFDMAARQRLRAFCCHGLVPNVTVCGILSIVVAAVIS